ncbi:MAG: type II toxin-antitoxin system RelB/DinJ family antitoxin [Bacilli bacterium]|nr:type II toxin-antitoxin system RelB/DinJ family antitoxin [Bacilli bacterium]
MPKTTLNLRIDSKIKKQAEKVVDELGISMSAAIVLYLKAIVRENGIPFDMKVRRPETPEAPKTKEKKKSKPSFDDDDFELPGSDSIRAAIDKF